MSHLIKGVSRYLADERAAAAAEMAIFAIVLAPIFLSLVDMGAYTYQRMQVQNAAQAGVQAAWATCDKVPANATNCPYLSTAVTAAVQGTSLSDTVTWGNAAAFSTSPIPATDAGYFCPDGTDNALTASSSGATCTSTGDSAGYYVKIDVTYNFSPVFPGVSIASLFSTPITQTTWTRLK
jgi:Flp pilus assembly protein TadG